MRLARGLVHEGLFPIKAGFFWKGRGWQRKAPRDMFEVACMTVVQIRVNTCSFPIKFLPRRRTLRYYGLQRNKKSHWHIPFFLSNKLLCYFHKQTCGLPKIHTKICQTFFESVWSAIKRITKYLTGLNEQLIGIKREQSNDQKRLNWIQDYRLFWPMNFILCCRSFNRRLENLRFRF